MKNKLLSLLFVVIIHFPVISISEVITLENCLRRFEKNSTSEKKIELYSKIREIEQNNLSSEFLPKLNLVGQLSYQNETIKLPISSQLFPIKEIPKDQYYTAFEIDQLVFDGFAISRNKDLSKERYSVNQASVRVETHKIKENIIKLYFSILILQKQKEINLLVSQDLTAKKKQFESMLSNGVMLRSDFNLIEIELIKRNQELIKIENDIDYLKNSLKIISQIDVNKFELSIPNDLKTQEAKPDERPEYILLSKSQEMLEKNKSIINSNYLPKISAFGKIGYASPNPNNFFETEFSSFYNVGLRFKFELFEWNRNYRTKEILELNKKVIEKDKENFERNFSILISEEKKNIEKYEKLAEKDYLILSLQRDIVRTSLSQLTNGTITMTEYINQFNNLERTQISYEMNKILKLNSTYNYLIKSNQITY
jgi:outer membrane protein TolC